MKELPVYKLTLTNEEDGVEFISIVPHPAINVEMLAFEDAEQAEQLIIEDEDERVIITPIFRCDYKMLRNDGDIQYYIEASRETVKDMCMRYHRNNKYLFDIKHNNLPLEDIYMYESYLIDRENGKNPPNGFEFLNDGDWVATIKVDNDYVWEAIKSGELKGISIDGQFTRVLDTEAQLIYEMQNVYTMLNNIL